MDALKVGDDETSVEFFQRLLLDIGDAGGGRLDVQRLGAWMFERVDEFGLGSHFASSELLCDELEHEVAIVAGFALAGDVERGCMQEPAEQADEGEEAKRIAERLVYG